MAALTELNTLSSRGGWIIMAVEFNQRAFAIAMRELQGGYTENRDIRQLHSVPSLELCPAKHQNRYSN